MDSSIVNSAAIKSKQAAASWRKKAGCSRIDQLYCEQNGAMPHYGMILLELMCPF